MRRNAVGTKVHFPAKYGDHGVSIEVTTVLFSLKIFNPECVYLLHGLSETCPLNTINGWCEEIDTTYGLRDV